MSIYRVETKAGIVDYITKYVGEVTRNEWKHDAWEVYINDIGVDFKTGLGRRNGKKPVPPKADDVIASLITDWQCAKETFEDFCGDLGYDTDSRTALQVYLDCQDTKNKLQRMKLGKTLDELEELYRNY